MKNFEFTNPTKIIFGRKSESEVGHEIKKLGFRKVLVHYGGTHIIECGLLDRVHRSLEQSNIAYYDFGGVVPNPELSHAITGAETGRKENVDFILAVGGGSVIDSAKAIAYGMANDFDLMDLFLGKVATNKILPVGCISTMASSGSETSNSTVMTLNTDGTKSKRAYNHDCARPVFAILNPELTYSVDAYHTAAGGADIMFHTMERYFSNVENTQLIDAIDEALLKTVRKELLFALAAPYDYRARANLMWAGSLSHNGLTGTGKASDFPVHKIAHELSARYNVVHGASLTAIWSTWCRYICKKHIDRFAQLAREVFDIQDSSLNPEETASAGIDAWEQWCLEINMPISLQDLGVSPSDEEIHHMAVNAAATGNGTIGKFFEELDVSDIENIYHKALYR